jgi:hypothetical protein
MGVVQGKPWATTLGVERSLTPQHLVALLHAWSDQVGKTYQGPGLTQPKVVKDVFFK